MLFNNVRETSTSTGTGNIIVNGASENGVRFDDAVPLNVHFSLIVDNGSGEREISIAKRIASNTLQRVLPQSGSSSLPVNFSPGIKQVFIGPTSRDNIAQTEGFSTLSSGLKIMVPSNYVRTNVTQGLTSNRIYYLPIFISRSVTIDLLGVRITTGQGSSSNNMHLGLYDINPTTGEPGAKIVSTTGLDPSVAALVTGTVPEVTLLFGWYYAAIWCDINPTLRSQGVDIVMRNPFTVVDNSSLSNVSYSQTNSQTGIADLPDTAAANAANVFGGNAPVLVVGHT